MGDNAFKRTSLSWRDFSERVGADESQQYQQNEPYYDAESPEDEEENEEEETEASIAEKRIQRELNNLLGIRANQVPEYILRMRDRGCMGYPPALMDE